MSGLGRGIKPFPPKGFHLKGFMAVAATGESIRAFAVPTARSRAAVRLWLYVLAALVVAMVAVGGATRLTGSGLSITEWRPVTGAVPPLSAAAWAAAWLV